MAVETEELTTREVTAPPADAARDEFVIDVPAGTVLPGLDELDETTPETAQPASTAETAKPVPAASETAPARETRPATERLHPAVREERGKRKRITVERDRYRNLYEQAEEEKARLASQMGPRAKPKAIEPDLSNVAKTVERADKAESLGAQAQVVLDEVSRMLKGFSEAQTDQMDRWATDLLEESFRSNHEDYDDLLNHAGVHQAIKVVNGRYRDPVVARLIYGSSNPAAAAYKYAKDKLQVTGEPGDEPSRDPGETERPAATTERPAEPAAEPKPEVEARRQGAREVAERVVNNANRSRGIRHVRPAGEGRVTVTAEYLDDLQTRNPEAFLKIMRSNPDLHRRYHGG